MTGAIAMPKPKKRPPQGAEIDLGPSVRVARGDVTVGFRADPEQPSRTVKGARVRVWYHAEWSEGRLTDAEHEAADRYSLWSEEAELLRHGKPRGAGIGGGGYTGPGDRLVWLLAQLRAADEVLAQERHAVHWAILWNCTPERPHAVRAGLRRLAEFWGM
jgi:hypothetical protein